ncbi:MAG: SIS domain-containing protein [bacterium]|nr:SIS domain-containing protein [bacterium]
MKQIDLKKESKELQNVIANIPDSFFESVEKAAVLLDQTYSSGGKVLICGNGGSAAEAQHFSDEMLGRYKKNRPSLPVVSLTADSAALTCIGNDFGFEELFARQVQGLGKQGDLLIGISTSGNSKNVLRAVEEARKKQMKVIALTAPQGALRTLVDVSIESPSLVTARIQELHLHVVHLLSEYFEVE